MQSFSKLLTLLLFLAFSSCSRPSRLVIMGSSIAQGQGASVPDSSWAQRLSRHLKGKMEVINLARGGYVTYQILPTGTVNPPDRRPVDTTRNITKALTYKPTEILISMTTNDVLLDYSLDEYFKNIETIRKLARKQHIRKVWITTSTPRNFPQIEKRRLLKTQRDRTLSTYGSRAINVYDIMADDQLQIKKPLDSGDGIHPTNTGHRILFEIIEKKIK